MRKPSTIVALGLVVIAGVFLAVVPSDAARSGLDRSAPVDAGAAVAPPSTSAAPAPPLAPPVVPPSVPATKTAEQQLEALTLEQRVGQLFMVAAGASGADANTMATLTDFHVGNVYLAGRSQAGTAATADVVAGMRASVSAGTSGGPPLFVATDQEGGFVQVLNGPGFSVIPTALQQAASSPKQLRADARTWGSELARAGVNVDLGPVLDTVASPQGAAANLPIGYYQREYGFTPAEVSAYGNAFAAGLRDAGVAPVAKHFPGLGRVQQNPDVSGNVHDPLTTRNDPYLEPFHAAITNGVRWVMVSSAYYDRIDGGTAGAFSPVMMRTMLRADAGFTGIIVSDDLCNAVQLRPWPLGDRAVNFIDAGGTMVLCADPLGAQAMYAQVLERAKGNAAFRAQVDAAALTVLRVKTGD